MSNIKLYYSVGAASLCVHWMLIEMGVEFDAQLVDIEKKQQKSDEYLKINPSGRIPAVEIDGKIYTESTAILFILSDHPSSKSKFKPTEGTEEYYRYFELMVYFANNLLPPFRDWYYAHVDSNADNEIEKFIKIHAQNRIDVVFNRIDQLLSDGRKYLLGNELRSVDFLGTMLMRWSRNLPKTAMEYPNLLKYIKMMRELPSFKELYKREGLTEWSN